MHTDPASLLSVIEEHALALATRAQEDEVVARLARQVTTLLEVEGSCVILADVRADLRAAAATGARSEAAARHQIEVAEGPCIDAIASGQPSATDDLLAERRWPEHRLALLAQGYRAAAAVPLLAASSVIGAVEAYSTVPRAWADEELSLVAAVGALTAGYVVHARALDAFATENAGLQTALLSRVRLEQAKGMLAERHGIQSVAAFERLRRHARDTNTRLDDVARAVIDRVLDP